MSWDLGWNAQSAVMPEKKVEIKVGDKGNDMIKAAMLLIQQKNKNQKQTKAAYHKPIINSQPRKNKGVEQRIRKDQQAHEIITMKNDKSLAVITEKLQKKVKVYKESEKNLQNHSQFLVDFVQKELSKQDEELQELKKQFYEGRLKDVMAHQQKIHESEQKVGSINDYVRENLAWEKQVLQQLNGQLKLSTDSSRVAQSFDKKLTEDQKQALKKVIQERIRQMQRIQELRQQRQEEQIQRIRKIKKLDLLSSSQDEGEDEKESQQQQKQ